MNFEYTDKAKALQERVSTFMDQHVYPIEREYEEFVTENLWQIWPGLEDLKAKASSFLHLSFS